MNFIISNFQYQFKSDVKQAKSNKMKEDMCKYQSLFPYLQSIRVI